MNTNGALGNGATRRIVCELDPTIGAEERVHAALAACAEQAAELHVVWVFQPGGFGLPPVLADAIELARERGIAATSAVRFGEHEVVLRRETGRQASICPVAAAHTSTLAA